jgi:hypothetical protein
MYTEQITQRLALAAGVPPQTVNGAAVNTDAIDMTKSRRAFFIVTFGATVGGTVTLSLQEDDGTGTWQANGSAGAFGNSGGAQVQQALAPPVANKVYTFEVRAGQLSTGKKQVRLNVNVSANNNLLSVAAYGDEGIHKPNNANNAGAVTTQSVVT